MSEQATSDLLRGAAAISAMFDRAQSEGRAAFLPYFPIGYPDYAASLDTIEGMARAGVDGFEIGIPFSDPLADGTVIQAATQRALENGITVRKCLEAVHELRARGVQQPMLMMGYLNPLLAYGFEHFVTDAKAAGADGLIIPDLPVEEGEEYRAVCARHEMALVFFLAPTSSTARVMLVAQRASGFIYVVSLTGVTGVRHQLPSDLTAFISRVRDALRDAGQRVPLVLGFGISTPEQARSMNGLVDGFIVGSALVRAGGQGAQAAVDLAAKLRTALDDKG